MPEASRELDSCEATSRRRVVVTPRSAPQPPILTAVSQATSGRKAERAPPAPAMASPPSAPPPAPPPPPAGLSARAARLRKPTLSYAKAFVSAMQEGLWEAGARPDGWIPLCIAEDKISNAPMLARLAAVAPPAGAADEWVLNYGGFRGTPELQAALAALMSRTFAAGAPPVDPEHVCVGAGLGGLLDHLFFILGDAGQSVLIPAPYYPAFDADLAAKNALVPTPVHLDAAGDVAAQLDAAAAAAAAAGRPACALLVTNPHNPLGTIYSEASVRAMLLWCLANGVHYVSDEVYALSVHAPSERFTSALVTAARAVADGAATRAALDARLHVLYGLSKDWAASGLRVGLVHSANAAVQQALATVVYFSGVGLPLQRALAEVLADEAWADGFIAGNRAALRRSYEAVTGALTGAGIPFVEAEAGMFVWLDLRAWLPRCGSGTDGGSGGDGDAAWEAERALWRRVCAARVILTPGRDCHAAAPGFFRLCFAWMPAEALPVAVARIAALPKPEEV